MTGPDRPWDDLHHRSYFLPELRRIEAGEYTLTMTGDRSFSINPLATHAVYTEGNMETIAKTMPIDISRTPSVMENVFVGAECSPKAFLHLYSSHKYDSYTITAHIYSQKLQKIKSCKGIQAFG
jgi:hypothetical protein